MINIYQEFIVDNANRLLLVPILYQEFKIWFKASYSGVKLPDRSTIKHELFCRGRLGNCLKQFIADNYDTVLLFPDIYPEFKFWFKASYPGIKIPNRIKVTDELLRKNICGIHLN